MKGGIGWKLITLALDRDPWKLYLMFLSREIDIQLCQNYTKINIYTILYKSSGFKKIKFSKCNQSEKDDIPEKANCKLGFLLYLLFLFLIDLIHNIIYTSVLLDQKFHQWQCSKVVTWYRRRHATSILLAAIGESSGQVI